MRGRQSRTSLRTKRNGPTYPLRKHLTDARGLTKNPRQWVKGLIGIGLILAFTVPVFRSGLKTNLTFFEFVWNHTVFSRDPVEYIPEEDYAAAFNKTKPAAAKSKFAYYDNDGIIATSKGGRGYTDQ